MTLGVKLCNSTERERQLLGFSLFAFPWSIMCTKNYRSVEQKQIQGVVRFYPEELKFSQGVKGGQNQGLPEKVHPHLRYYTKNTDNNMLAKAVLQTMHSHYLQASCSDIPPSSVAASLGLARSIACRSQLMITALTPSFVAPSSFLLFFIAARIAKSYLLSNCMDALLPKHV